MGELGFVQPGKFKVKYIKVDFFFAENGVN